MNGAVKNLSPKHLRVLVHLSETLSFSRTAEHFHYTQPTLSKIVKETEAAFGKTLFERTTRHVALTVAGAELIGLARRVIRHYDDGLQRLADENKSLSYKISISALPSLASALLPEVVRRLEERFPAVVASIFDGSSEATLQLLVRDQVEFALTSADPTRRDMRYEELLRDRFVLISAGSLAEKMTDTVNLRDLNDLPIISMSTASTAQKYMVAAFTNQDAEFRPKMVFDQISTIGSFVEIGLGAAVLPYLAVPLLMHLENMRITHIVGAPTRSVGIVTLRDIDHSFIAKETMAELRDQAKKIIATSPQWVIKGVSTPA